MSNDRTGRDNNWDDELDVPQDDYDTEEPRPRRRRLPPEQPPARRPRPTTESRQSSPQRPQRPRPTSDFGQTQRPQRPRPTSDPDYSQDYPQDAPRRRAYTDEQQQGRSRSSFDDRVDRVDRTQRQRSLRETEMPQSPRPRPNTGMQSRQTQRRPRATASSQRERRSRRPRRMWPWLLFGCLGGILLVVLGIGIAAYLAVRNATGGSVGIGGIGSATTYTQNKQYPVSISGITQLQIHNQIGDVTITVDPNATTPTVSTTKSVKASSQNDANNQFNSIAVQVEPAGTPATTLAVNAHVSGNNSIFGNHNNSVAIVITLPASVNTGGTPVVLNGGNPISSITSVGNITITGLNGNLNVKNDIGNITVQNALLSPGSTLQANSGNVTFKGTVDTAAGSNSNPSIYTIQSESGNLDVTLPANINLTLDVYTNVGTISSDFNLSQIKQSSDSYSGPIIYGTTPNALLKLHVSTGNVALHKG